MDGDPLPEVQPQPPVAGAAAQRYVYASPTRPNPLELAWFGMFLLLLLAALALPWTLVAQASRSGLNFDTWKLAQAGGGPEAMLPLGASDYLMGDQGLLAVYRDGMWALCKEHADQRAAVSAWRGRWAGGQWPDGVLGAATHVGSGQWLAFASMQDGGRLLEWVSGRHTMQFFAFNDSDLTLMILESSMIDARGEPRYGIGVAPLSVRLLRFNAPWTALALNMLTILLLLGLYWRGIRRQRLIPAEGGRRLGREALRTLLLGLNSANAPVVIEEQEPYHLIARWKVDDADMARWMAGRNLREAWQLDIYLGDKATVSLLETKGRLSWDGRESPPRPAFHWNYLREIAAASAAPSAASSEPEQAVLPAQSIDPADYRRALQQILLSSGWSVKPLLFRPLVWEYR